METIKVGWYAWDLLIKEGKFRDLGKLSKYRSYRFQNLYTGKQLDGFVSNKSSEDGVFYDYVIKLGY